MRSAYAAVVTVIAIVSLLGNYLLYQRYSSQRPLITVNGQVIHRKDLEDRLDYLYSKNILTQMINSDLVMQEAQKDHVMPTDADVQRAYDQVNRANPTVIVQQQKIDPDLIFFKQGLKAELALTNLRTKDVHLSDQEVQEFYQTHLKQFALPEQTNEILVVAQDQIDAQTAQRMLSNNVSPSVIAETKGLRVAGINTQASGVLPEAIGEQLMNGKPGEIRTAKFGNQYLVAKLQNVSQQQVPSLASIRPEVEMAAKLAKAPSEQQVMAQLLEKANIVANTDKYRDAIPTASGEQTASAGH
jgi:hypothetical protein